MLTAGGMVLGLKLDNGEKFAELLEEVTLPLDAGRRVRPLHRRHHRGDERRRGSVRRGAPRRTVEEHADLPFEELRERILREVRAFAGEPGPHDDMTLILLKVEPSA